MTRGAAKEIAITVLKNLVGYPKQDHHEWRQDDVEYLTDQIMSIANSPMSNKVVVERRV